MSARHRIGKRRLSRVYSGSPEFLNRKTTSRSRQQAISDGFRICGDVYPNVAYKGTMVDPIEWCEVPTEAEEAGGNILGCICATCGRRLRWRYTDRALTTIESTGALDFDAGNFIEVKKCECGG